MRSLRKLFRHIESSIKGITNPFKIISTLKEIATSKEFTEHAESIASKMATHVYSSTVRTWRQAARESGKGKEIYKALESELDTQVGMTFRNIISENSRLIKSVPENMCEYVSNYVAKESMKGKRASAIAEELQEKFPALNSNRATLIARTETSKASTALTEARSRDLGLKWYVWRSSEDSRVRSSHSHLEGVLINWNDPPSPEALIGKKSYGKYSPGNIFNCRCYSQPVVNLSRIKFPVKVYYQGKIQRMTKTEFEKLL